MRSPKRRLARLPAHPVVWALVYAALLAYGVHALTAIPVEVLPPFNFPQVSVIVHQPGGSARELEALVVRPLEGRLLTLPNVETVRSVMSRGSAEIDIRFRQGTSEQLDLQAAQSAIDRARGELPQSVHPYAQVMGSAINEVADYALALPPEQDPATVERMVRTRIVPALRAIPGIRRVDAYGAGDEALWIEPNLHALQRYGVSVAALAQAVRAQVLMQPSGYLSLGHQDVLMEARNLPTHAAQLAQTPVPAAHGPIPLEALARVVRSAVPIHSAILLDGHPAIALTVFKQANASTVPVTQAVSRALAELRGELPAGLRWVRIYSQGHLVHLVGTDLGRNLLIGAGLAIGVLVWVLGAARGIWTLAFSIPLSLLLGIAGLYFAGQTLNLMTLGALTIAVGMLADDAIIVLESIYHRWERGASRWGGIRRGLRDIAIPDVTGTLTTVAVYVPLVFVGGLAGLFFVPFALAMTLALLGSLLVSLSFIPLGLGLLCARASGKPTAAGRLVERLRRWNAHLLDVVVHRPRLSLAVCIMLLLGSLAGLVLVPVNFLPLPNEGVLLDSFTLPPGTSLPDTEATVETMTRKLRRDPAVVHVFARIGSPANTAYIEPAYAGEIQIVLKSAVGVSALDQIASRLLAESRMPAVQASINTPTIERLGESLSGLPQPFVVRLYGSSIAELRAISEKVAARLKKLPQLSDVFNNDAYPVTQLQITPNMNALNAYGLTPAEFYQQIQLLLAGKVIAQVPYGAYYLDLYMRLPGAPELSVASLRNLPIRSAGWTPLGQLASVSLETAPNQIRHIDGARALDILATPNGTPGAAISAAKQALASLHLPAGYRIGFGGLYPELEHDAVGLAIAAVVAFVLMAGILLLQFDGALVPGLLLLQIPLAITGGAFALIASGVGLNAIGMVAFLTLIGIGLNHGIVLLDRARRNEAAGMSPEAATREAVQVRFRPILLTTLTAAVGMLPTALGWGKGAAPEQGLALMILGGIIWSALLSTNLLPGLYIHWHGRRFVRIEPPSPAAGNATAREACQSGAGHTHMTREPPAMCFQARRSNEYGSSRDGPLDRSPDLGANLLMVVVLSEMIMIRNATVTVALAVLFAPALARATTLRPVYIHMNGGNYFLEPVVAVRPGQKVVFVNQDTGAHTVVGYNPATGALSSRFDGPLLGTKGPGHKLSTYTVSFSKPGLEPYFCSVHAELATTFGKAVQPIKRMGTHGFKGPMAGLIVVTTDRALIAENAPTTKERVVKGFFGG
jgi:cobalt-zinc-cadmium resistance protein CzcA